MGAVWVFCRHHLFLVSISGLIRGPERKVVSQKLHNHGGVFVAGVVEPVKLIDRLVESRFRDFACLFLILENLVLTNREVQGNAKSGRMGLWQALRLLDR